MACGQEPGRAAAGAAELGLDPKSSREPLRSLEQGRCLVSLALQKGLCGPKGQNEVPRRGSYKDRA